MKYTIGSYPAVSLGQAHGDAGKALESVRLGIDPAATKRRGPPPEGTVKALIATYREQMLGEGVVTTNTRKKAERELKRIGAAIGDRQFKSVTKHDLQKIIDERIADGVYAQKATHVRVVAFCTWASKRLDIDSPADNLAKPIEDTERDRFLDDAEIRILVEGGDRRRRRTGHAR